MSNAKTGLLSAIGAVIGGAIGATAGYYSDRLRPRRSYVSATRGDAVEDAMVVGGAAGAVVGAFIGGAAAGEESPPPPQLPPR